MKGRGMDQADGIRQMRQSGRPGARPLRVIAVTSGKGGVGKSNLVVNLGVCFARNGREVLIVDGDVGLANVDILLGIEPKYNFRHVLRGEQSLGSVILTSADGISVLPASSAGSDLIELTTEHKLHLMSELDNLGNRFDTVLIDTPAGIGSNVLFFAASAQDVIVEATPEPTSLADAYATIKVLALRCGVKRILLVVNQVSSQHEADDVYRRLTSVADRFLPVVIERLGAIPADESVKRAVMMQRPLAVQFPTSPASRAIEDLAIRLLARPMHDGPGGGMQIFWSRLLNANGPDEPDMEQP
ncbi:MAG: site-determining protein [Myxococcales bacterium]